MRESPHDQATGLRRLFAQDTLQVLSVQGADDALATDVTIDLATALLGMGYRPLIVDLQKGHVAIALGLKPRYELSHVLSADKTMTEVLLMSTAGIGVLPATRGLERASERGCWKQILSRLLHESPQAFNIWLINGVVGAVAETESPLLVIAPTRAAITKTYGQIKALARDHGRRDFRMVVDRAASEPMARAIYSSMAETARRFLCARLDYCGYLPADPQVCTPKHGAAPRVTDHRSPRGHAFSRLAEAVFSVMPLAPPQLALDRGR